MNNRLTPFSWWKGAKLLGYVKSQDEMDKANQELSKSFRHNVPYPGTAKARIHELRWKLFNIMFRVFFGTISL
jgi:hypothetical protein